MLPSACDTAVLRSREMDAAVWIALAILAAMSLGTLFSLGARIDSLAARTDARFDRMDARFDHVDGRFDTLIGRMDARFDALDARFDALAARLDTPIGTDTRPDSRPTAPRGG
jgi:hypothetical protein